MHLAKSHLILVVHTYIQYQPCWCSAGFHKVFQFHYDLTLELKFQCKDFHSQATVLCLENWNWQHLVDCTCDICTCLLVEHNSIKCKNRLYCILYAWKVICITLTNDKFIQFSIWLVRYIFCTKCVSMLGEQYNKVLNCFGSISTSY